MENRYMRLAIDEAKKAAEAGEVPVGAVIVKNGEVISTGRNRREKEKNALCHAELEAIDKACKRLGGWRLSGCELYVTLEPCPMCAGAIINSRLKSVYYGAFDSKAGSFGSVADFNGLRYNHKPEIYAGIMEDECQSLLTDFFKNIRNKKERD